jgi:uncharacterized protein YqeY
MSETLKQRLQQDMKAAMRARESERLGTIRLIMAAIKQQEVDERIELDDQQVIDVLTRMVKQRRDSLDQYQQAGRQDLADKETAELALIEGYLPPALDDAELNDIIADVIAATGAESPRDMGKVMGQLKPRIQGRADMGKVSALVKDRLAGA